ncbi:hypothetical protein [Bartonella saheliensis]|uniref:hypothetical protein n=1 Tax=Bartonella saheliensis TaxID=1457016 RepID=UPI00140D8F52|nr:hypothetical protein [Bartonella saheliensis]
MCAFVLRDGGLFGADGVGRAIGGARMERGSRGGEAFVQLEGRRRRLWWMWGGEV